MNDTLLDKNPMNRKKKGSRNERHTPSKRVRLNKTKFADYCSITLRHAVETPFQAYADEFQMTSKQYHISSETGTSSILLHSSKLDDRLLPTSYSPVQDPSSPSLTYGMVGVNDNGPNLQYLDSTKVSLEPPCSTPFHILDAPNKSDTERYISTKCNDTPSSSAVDTVHAVTSPSCHEEIRNLTNDLPGANKSYSLQPCSPSKLPNGNKAVIELKPLFPSLHPPEAVTMCSASILTCRTSLARHFFRGSVTDITLAQPSASSHGELDDKPSSGPPLQPDSAVDGTSKPEPKTISKPKSVVPLVPVHGSALYSSMPNSCERFPRPICTGDTLTGRHMECENAPSSSGRLMSMDDENRKHKTLVNLNTKAASASVKQPKSIKYRRHAYSEKLKLRCSN